MARRFLPWPPQVADDLLSLCWCHGASACLCMHMPVVLFRREEIQEDKMEAMDDVTIKSRASRVEKRQRLETGIV